MAARVDAVVSRVQTAITMRQVSMSMKGVVKSMERAMQSMNLVQVQRPSASASHACCCLPLLPGRLHNRTHGVRSHQLSQLMEKFEQQFEDLDVQASVMEGAMASTSVASMPEVSSCDCRNPVKGCHGLRHLLPTLPLFHRGKSTLCSARLRINTALRWAQR
jgi:charged multivesicular body protein 1